MPLAALSTRPTKAGVPIEGTPPRADKLVASVIVHVVSSEFTALPFAVGLGADGPPAASAGDSGDPISESAGRELADVPAIEVISRAAMMLMSAAAEQLGLGAPDPDNPDHRDLDEARTLIAALAGLVSAALPRLGTHASGFRDGLAALQKAFREYSVVPDEDGAGPGETPFSGAQRPDRPGPTSPGR